MTSYIEAPRASAPEVHRPTAVVVAVLFAGSCFLPTGAVGAGIRDSAGRSLVACLMARGFSELD